MKNSDYQYPVSYKIAALDSDKIEFPLMVRKWEQGDFFYPLGMKNKKKISDFLIDQKISLNDKQHVMVLCSGQSVLWVIGKRIDNRYKITPETSRILEIKLETINPED